MFEESARVEYRDQETMMDGFVHTAGVTEKISELSDQKAALLRTLVREHSELPWMNVLGASHREALGEYYVEQWKGREAELLFASDPEASHLAAIVLEPLPWDSNLLGMNCARLYPVSSPKVLPENWQEQDFQAVASPLSSLLKERGIALADIKVSSADLYLMRALEAASFHTVDVLLTLGADAKKLREVIEEHAETFRMLNREAISFNDGVTVRPIRPDEVSEMEALARLAFADTDAIKDRFYLEPTIEHSRANELFLEWFRNSVRKQLSGSGVVLIAEKKGEALGFLTLDEPSHPALGGYWQDGLNAVNVSARGQGVYRSLVLAAMQYALAHDGSGLITRTQISTTRVINTWLHLGAKLYESFCTLHWTGE